jgi:hypothetical protein
VDKELAIKWVAELRSGRWPQGKGFLNMNGRFCCLGVLCEVMVQAGLAERHEVDHQRFTYRPLGISDVPPEAWTAYPIPALQAAVGVVASDNIKESGFKVTYQGTRVDLYILNDSYGLSFAEIADIIEKEWIND